jgi:uncharacterized phiE125 gp8 family phage protein
MTLILKTAPTTPLFTLDQIKNHLCLTDDYIIQDANITDYGDAVTDYLDGNDGVLGRGLITQTYTMIINFFPNVIHVPLPPLQTVDEIRYLDTAGVQQILAASIYRVVYAGAVNRRAIITLAKDQSWPSVDIQIGAVEIDFTCGYGDSWNNIPPNTRQLALLLLGSLFETRDAEITGTSFDDNPAAKRAIVLAKFQEAV